MKLRFRDFLLNENKYYLGNRVGSILTALQDLVQNGDGMGTRQLVANVERITHQIRGVLQMNWSPQEEKYLKTLQRAGVALARCIDEKDDLQELIPAVVSELEEMSSDLGVPTNDLGHAASEE